MFFRQPKRDVPDEIATVVYRLATVPLWPQTVKLFIFASAKMLIMGI